LGSDCAGCCGCDGSPAGGNCGVSAFIIG
jgi:hypothetical protein